MVQLLLLNKFVLLMDLIEYHTLDSPARFTWQWFEDVEEAVVLDTLPV